MESTTHGIAPASAGQREIFTEEIDAALAEILESCLSNSDLTLNLNNTNATTTLSSRILSGGELLLCKLSALLRRRNCLRRQRCCGERERATARQRAQIIITDLTLNLNNTNATTTTLSSRLTPGGELFLVKLPSLLEKRRRDIPARQRSKRRTFPAKRRSSPGTPGKRQARFK